MAPEMRWPLCPGDTEAPQWTGQGFQVGGQPRPFLLYHEDQRAWDQGLTGLHEEEAGEDHFIDVASRQQAMESLKRWVQPQDGAILEVGMSSGFFLSQMKGAFPGALVIGSDSFPEVLASFAKKDPGVPLLGFDLAACPLPDACLDAVVLLNVLEHIQDDARALHELARILKPGGVLVLEVPAGPWLYDVYDELLRHFRRYTMAGLVGLVQDAGLKPVWRSHLGFFLFPAFALVKRLNRLRFKQGGESKREKVAAQIGGSRHQPFLTSLMGLERRLGRHLYLPFGIRCLMVARKPGPQANKETHA
jgi:SAM-dependent methyltransferase